MSRFSRGFLFIGRAASPNNLLLQRSSRTLRPSSRTFLGSQGHSDGVFQATSRQSAFPEKSTEFRGRSRRLLRQVKQPRLDQPFDREELLNYFKDSWQNTDYLFDLFDDASFYKVAHPDRHPLIFYLGHVAAFYVNKMSAVKMIDPIMPRLEETMALGVFQRPQDANTIRNSQWPTVTCVRDYRKKVFARVVQAIDQLLTTETEIDIASPIWALLMAIEHERIHFETSLVLFRDLPLTSLKPSATHFLSMAHKGAHGGGGRVGEDPENEFVQVPRRTVALGLPIGDIHHFFWDLDTTGNICHAVEVPSFAVQRYFVSNGAFLKFVLAGGYDDDIWWTTNGKQWKLQSAMKHPRFWTQSEDGLFKLRMCFEERLLSDVMNLPVIANLFEAEAYANWLSKRDDFQYYPIREEQVRALLAEDGARNDLDAEMEENFSFIDRLSERPVEMGSRTADGVVGVTGNVWHRTSSVASALPGFEKHELYVDYSEPYLEDGEHCMVLGGCFASSGSYAQEPTRNFFKPEFPQFTGIRLVYDVASGDADCSVAPFLEDERGEQLRSDVNLGQSTGRLSLQCRYTEKEKGWLKQVERKIVGDIGLGLFAAEHIKRGDRLRTGILGKNLWRFHNEECVKSFLKMFGSNSGAASYVREYSFGLQVGENDFFYGLFFPGNGINHNNCKESRNIRLQSVYSADREELLRIDVVAIKDIEKGAQIFDDYSTFGPAPSFLTTWSEGVELTFPGCNGFVAGVGI